MASVHTEEGRRTGLKLFFWNLTHSFLNLVVLNMLFVLTCLPVVTIGAAAAAMSRICCQLTDGQHLIYPIQEYWNSFKSNLKQGFVAELICILYMGMIFYGFEILNYRGNTSGTLRIILIIALLMFWMFAIYVFPQIGMLKLKMKQIVGNAWRLMLMRMPQSFAAVLLCGAALLGPLYLLPLSVVLYVFVLFSVCTLICSAFTWPGIRKYLVKNDGIERE